MKEKDKYIENSTKPSEEELKYDFNKKQQDYYKQIYENQTFDFSNFIKNTSAKIKEKEASIEISSKNKKYTSKIDTKNIEPIDDLNQNLDFKKYQKVKNEFKSKNIILQNKVKKVTQKILSIKWSILIILFFSIFTLIILSLVPIKPIERIVQKKIYKYGFNIKERKIVRFDPFKMSFKIDNLNLSNPEQSIAIRARKAYYNVISNKITFQDSQIDIKDEKIQNLNTKSFIFFQNKKIQLINQTLNIIINSEKSETIKDVLSFKINGEIFINKTQKNINLRSKINNKPAIIKYFSKKDIQNLKIQSPILNLNYNNNKTVKDETFIGQYEGEISMKYTLDTILKNYASILTQNISENLVKINGIVYSDKKKNIIIKNDKNNNIHNILTINKEKKQINANLQISKINIKKHKSFSSTNQSLSTFIYNIMERKKFNINLKLDAKNINFEDKKIIDSVNINYNHIDKTQNDFKIKFPNNHITIQKKNGTVNFAFSKIRNFHKIINSFFLKTKLDLDFSDNKKSNNDVIGSFEITDLSYDYFNINGKVILNNQDQIKDKFIIFDAKKAFQRNLFKISSSFYKIHPKDFINHSTMDKLLLQCVKNNLNPSQQHMLSSVFFCNQSNINNEVDLRFYNFKQINQDETSDMNLFLTFGKKTNYIYSNLKIQNINNDIQAQIGMNKDIKNDVNFITFKSKGSNYNINELKRLATEIFNNDLKINHSKNYNIMSFNNFNGNVDIEWKKPKGNANITFKSSIENGIFDVNKIFLSYKMNTFISNGSIDMRSKPYFVLNIGLNWNLKKLFNFLKINQFSKHIKGFVKINGSMSSKNFFSIDDLIENLESDLSIKTQNLGIKNFNLLSLSKALITSRNHSSIDIDKTIKNEKIMYLNPLLGNLSISKCKISTEGINGKEVGLSSLIKFEYDACKKYFNDLSLDFMLLGIKPNNSSSKKAEFISIPFAIKGKGSLQEGDFIYKKYPDRIKEYIVNMTTIQSMVNTKK